MSHEQRIEALVSELEHDGELTLVFVRTKHGADRLVKRLRGHGVDAVAMHGNKSQRQREQALARFESGRVDVLVATDVAARGIDVAGISHVINFDPPHDGETYVHRIGRTGRAGAQGIGITLVSDDQRHDVGRLAGVLGLDHDLGGGPRGQRSKARQGRPRPAARQRADRRSRSSAPRSGAPRQTSR
ncbi:MAG: helicase-related protein [Solirubrobacteraceae bacterium]